MKIRILIYILMFCKLFLSDIAKCNQFSAFRSIPTGNVCSADTA